MVVLRDLHLVHYYGTYSRMTWPCWLNTNLFMYADDHQLYVTGSDYNIASSGPFHLISTPPPPPHGRVFQKGPPVFGVISEGYTLCKWFSEGLVILRFSEGCLTNTNSPFAFSHYAKKSKSGNKGRRYFSSQPLLALFFSPILGKAAYS